MNKAELIQAVAAKAELDKKTADKAVAAVIGAITDALAAGEKNFSPEILSRYLYHSELPDPELIIRTSGEERLSNFLLWQAAYSEFYFTPVLWPDFNEQEFEKALAAYASRTRRFGGI